MSRQRRASEQAIHDALVYHGTEIWRNKLDIREQAALDAAEAHIMAVRSLTRPIFKAFTLKEMQALHKHLLSDLYEWAGTLRQYTTGRSAASFARPEYIESYFASAVERPLQREGYLRELAKEDFAARAAHFVNEANAVHPFADGNGRVTRFFLADLAQQAGWPFPSRASKPTKAPGTPPPNSVSSTTTSACSRAASCAAWMANEAQLHRV